MTEHNDRRRWWALIAMVPATLAVGLDVTILSVALLLRHSLDLAAEAEAVERAVARAISDGVRTVDIAPAGHAATTRQAGDAVLARLAQ